MRAAWKSLPFRTPSSRWRVCVGFRAYDGQFLPEQCVEERGFADVRSANDGHEPAAEVGSAFVHTSKDTRSGKSVTGGGLRMYSRYAASFLGNDEYPLQSLHNYPHYRSFAAVDACRLWGTATGSRAVRSALDPGRAQHSPPQHLRRLRHPPLHRNRRLRQPRSRPTRPHRHRRTRRRRKNRGYSRRSRMSPSLCRWSLSSAPATSIRVRSRRMGCRSVGATKRHRRRGSISFR